MAGLLSCRARRTVPSERGPVLATGADPALHRRRMTLALIDRWTQDFSGPSRVYVSNVVRDNSSHRRFPVATWPGHCTEAHLGCPCRGDRTIHEERAKEISEARARSKESVECPECGGSATPLQLVTWAHCGACHRAESRSIRPLRW